MPELPNLEVFARNLNRRFADKELKEIKVLQSKTLNVSEKELKTALEGKT